MDDIPELIDGCRDDVCHEARETVNQQLKQISSHDTKSVGLFRANILLAGILLSGLAIVARTDAYGPGQFLNIWTRAGGAALFLSTLSAAMAYTSSSYEMGIASDIIEDVQNENYNDVEQLKDEIGDVYRQCLELNDLVSYFNGILITLSMILLLNSILLLLGGVVSVLNGWSSAFSDNMFLVSLIVIASADALIYLAEDLFMFIYT